MNRLGLLNRVLPAERLVEAATELLARVTRHTAVVLASQKRLFEIWQNRPLTDGSSIVAFRIWVRRSVRGRRTPRCWT